MKITSRMPRDEYDRIGALNISRLKEIKRSPQHYRYRLTHPHTTDAMTLGTATHVATLEPERFATDFIIWDRKTDSGKAAPRNGKAWDEFKGHAASCGYTILTADEAAEAKAIAAAVRSNETAMIYLQTGDPEVTIEATMHGRPCRGRVDWLTTVSGHPHIVGLKTARDCRHFAFGNQAAKLGYHIQWAWYLDLMMAIRETDTSVVEIVVESAPPYAVAVYRIGTDIIEQGRDDYMQLLETLNDCERRDIWPGPVPSEEWLTLPSWAYPQADDLNDLELETA
jgi:hypothetical protein